MLGVVGVLKPSLKVSSVSTKTSRTVPEASVGKALGVERRITFIGHLTSFEVALTSSGRGVVGDLSPEKTKNGLLIDGSSLR